MKRRSATGEALEAEWTRTVIETAQALGWVACHHPDSRLLVGNRGAPDIELVHPSGGYLRLELKRRGRKPDRDQLMWHTLLRNAGITVEVIVVPDELSLLVGANGVLRRV